MKPDKYFLSIIVGFTLSALAYVVFMLLLSGPFTDEVQAWRALYEAKVKFAKSRPSPKIIVTSGSNGIYGISTKLIESRTNIPSVNMSINANFPLDYQFKTIKKIAQSGDIIIVPLEYEFYTALSAANGNLSFTDYLFSYDPNYLNSLSLSEIASFYSQRLNLIFALGRDQFFNRLAYKHSALKRFENNINDHGDIAHNPRSEATVVAELERGVVDPGRLAPDRSAEVTPYFKVVTREFSTWCKDNNVLLLASFPSMLHSPEYDSPARKQFYSQVLQFYWEADIPVLGTPESFTYDKSNFYNSIYHLHNEATVKRTEQLLNLAKPYLKKAAATRQQQLRGQEVL